MDLDPALGFNGSDSTRRSSFSGDHRARWPQLAGRHQHHASCSAGPPEKGASGQSRYALAQAELREKQLEQDVWSPVRNAVRDVETSRGSAMIAARAADLAQRQYEAETDRFRGGLSTSSRCWKPDDLCRLARVANPQACLD